MASRWNRLMVSLGFRAPESPAEARISLARLSRAVRQSGTGIAQNPTRVSSKVKEALYRQEPMLQRGIKKQTGDLLKHGFTIVKPGTSEPHEKNEEFQAWMRDSNLDYIIRDGLIGGHVHGDGPVEIEWDDNGASTDPVQDGAIPVAVHVIDPYGIQFEAFSDDDGQTRYYLVQRNGGDVVALHPDRYHDFRHTCLPGFVHGLSTVEAAYYSAISKVKGDQAIGEQLYFSGISKVLATVKDGKQPDLDAVTAMLNDPAFVRAWVWDERLTVTPINPGTLDPTPHYEVLIQSIAASIGMPVAILKGVQAGEVTGSETNLSDYHADLHQVQVTLLEPFYTRLFEGKFSLEAKDFDFIWEPFPMGKAAEATLRREQASAYTLLTTAGLKPLSAAKMVGMELTEEDLEPKMEVPPTLLPPGQPSKPGAPPPPMKDMMDKGKAGEQTASAGKDSVEKPAP